MQTYRLVVAYDGGPFHGFARQPNLETVQGTIEGALAKLFGEEIKTSCAGRTDAGVHALGQVVSFNASTEVQPQELVRRLNSLSGPAISVIEAAFAAEGFDARFSAEARSYEYAIFNRETPDPFSRHTTWHYSGSLDVEAMGQAAEALLGEHAFDSFGRVEEGQSPVRRIESIDIEKAGDLISIKITANSFLQQMVRSIVGTLMKVGAGSIDPDQMGSILHARDRAKAGPVAPPHGLFLVSVSYPNELVTPDSSRTLEKV